MCFFVTILLLWLYHLTFSVFENEKHSLSDSSMNVVTVVMSPDYFRLSTQLEPAMLVRTKQ